MSVRNMQFRTMLSGLMVAASLLATAQADPAQSSPDDHEQRQCGAASPLLLSLGDAYFDLADFPVALASSPANPEQSELLSSLLDTHFSDGWGISVRCIGSADQVRAQSHRVSLEDIEGRKTRYPDLGNAISITAYEFDEPSRRLSREIVTIPTRPQDMIFLDERSLETSSRHRQATRRGSYLREIRIDASLSDDTVIIDQSLYVNGSLAQWQTWHLSE